MMTELEDRRIFERFSARLAAKVKDSREAFGDNLYLRDASADGAQLMAKDKFFINDSITIELDIPGEYPLTLKGTVVWVSKQNENRWDFGLKFHKLDLMNVSRLYERASSPVTQ